MHDRYGSFHASLEIPTAHQLIGYTERMQKLFVASIVALTGICVALTYFVFEAVVSAAIDLVWHDLFNTNTYRLLIVPIVFVMTYTFFWLQHRFDQKGESREEQGLGSMPDPTLKNYGKTLLIGFFSLVAGASLGPEAILVPASMILGSFLGRAFFGKDTQLIALISGVAIVALFTAFFHSFIIGILSIFLVMKQSKAKLTPALVVAAAISAGAAALTLSLLPSEPYMALPHFNWGVHVSTIVWLLLLVAIGFGMVWMMHGMHVLFQKLYGFAWMKTWWVRAGIAAAGLVLLYLIGGPLIQFTGNESIVPLIEYSANIGAWGLASLLILKVIAMSWSKAIGYRGGMIFPTVFLAATSFAIIHLFVPELNVVYALIATLIGAFIANSKTGILV